jgi:hypothetical protein
MTIAPPDGRGPRSVLTTIDFLLEAGQFSAWHRVASDEVWHLVEGPGLRLWLVPPSLDRIERVDLQPVSAGSLGLRVSEDRGKRREYEDFRPTRFVPGPEGEGQYPEYPWVAKGPQPKDFLGNEFLLWLWHEADGRTGIVGTESAGDVTVYIDRSLDLDCAYGQTGRDTLKGDGPSRMPEARDALRSGKLPRKAGMVLDANGLQYSLTFNPEGFAVGSAKLP